MTQEVYLSVYASFANDAERRAWMKDHVVKHSIPHGGPIYSFSIDKESQYRDLCEELLEALEMAYGYVHKDTSPKGKADAANIRAAIAKARGQ